MKVERKTQKRIVNFLYASVTILTVFLVLGMTGFISNAKDEEEIENPYIMHYIAEDLNKKSATADGDGVSFKQLDESNITSGVLVSAKKKSLENAVITYKNTYDFGSDVNKIRVDGLTQKGTKIYVDFYMDEETTPFKSIMLNTQSAENDWSKSNPVFTDIPDGILNGSHHISFKLRIGFTSDKNISVLLRSVKFYKEAVPTIYINIDEDMGTIESMNSSNDHSVNCYGDITVKTPAGFKSDYLDESAATTTYKTYPMEYIRGRGNSTWLTTKKPYKIKLQNRESLFGMDANKHWALIANYYDKSLLRNRMTYYMGAAMGMPYTPKLVPVDVIMNGKYLGSYYLSEVVRLDEGRVDLDNLETGDSDNITGGYLLGMTPYGKEDGYMFTTAKNVNFVVESPVEVEGDTDGEKIRAMNNYIEDYIKKTENAIFGKDFKDENGIPYSEYLDFESTVKYSLVQAVSANGDAYATPSTKLYKKRDGKLYFGPLWDFDYVAWKYDGAPDEELNFYCNWFQKLLSDPVYVDALRKAWFGENENDAESMRYQLEKIAEDGGKLDQYYEKLKESAEANYDIDYRQTFGNNNFDDVDDIQNPDSVPNDDGVIDNEEEYIEEIIKYTNAEDYKAEVEALKNWLRERILWVDENINEVQPGEDLTIRVSFYNDNKLVDEYTGYQSLVLNDFPEIPKKDGYIFCGWYGEGTGYDSDTDEDITIIKQYKPGSYIAKSIRLDAKWVPEDEMIKVEDIVLNTEEITLERHGNYSLKYTVLPFNATERELTFTTSDPDVCLVDSEGGLFAGKKVGDAVITAKSVDGKKATCLVHVLEDPNNFIENLTVSETELEMTEGDTHVIKIGFEPQEAKYPEVKFINTNPEVATIYDSGVIVANKAGETKIVVVADDVEGNKVIKINVKPADEKNDDDKKSDTEGKDDKKSDGDSNNDKSTDNNEDDSYLKVKKLVKNTIFTVGKVRYQVIKPCKMSNNKVTQGTVRVVGFKKDGNSKYTLLTVPDTVTKNNNTFKVVSIKAGAFKNCKKLKKVIVGKNVTAVGQKAFYGCKKLKTVTFKGKKCTFGKKAFAKIAKKAKFYAPKKRIKAFKKALKKVGIKNVYKK